MPLNNNIVLNLVKNEKSCKIGVKVKQLKADWKGDNYLLRVIGFIQQRLPWGLWTDFVSKYCHG